MNIKEYIASGVIETVVMGIAEPQEVAELERLRREYPEVDEYAIRCEDWLQEAAMQQSAPVPDSSRQAFLQFMEEDQHGDEGAAPVVPMPVDTTGGGRSVNMFKYAAVASVLLLIGSAVLNFYLYGEYSRARQAYADLNSANILLASKNKEYEAKMVAMNRNTEIITSPAYVKVPMGGIPGKEEFSATVFWNKETTEVFFIANNLPAAPAGKQYQLWALVDGQPVDAGVLGDCNDLCHAKNISKAQAFAITLENAGGSPQPNLEQLYVMGKIVAG